MINTKKEKRSTPLPQKILNMEARKKKNTQSLHGLSSFHNDEISLIVKFLTSRHIHLYPALLFFHIDLLQYFPIL